MAANDLQSVAETVIRQAEQKGYVVPREVRAVLAEAGLSQTLWKDVLTLARSSLRYRNGRYYHDRGVSDTVRREQDQQRQVRRAVRALVRDYRSAHRDQERRQHQRCDFVQLVRIHTEAGATHTLLSRDISASGVRLLGTKRLLGQKVRLVVPRPGGENGLGAANGPSWTFVVRILWTCGLGDDLFENGGTFLEVSQ